MEAALGIEEPIASPFKATETLCGLPPVHQASFWRALSLLLPVSSLRYCYKNVKKLYDLLSISFQIFQSL
jgi:hypothetical protein